MRRGALLKATAPALALLLACLILAGWIPASARADGDPASDVLASQRLFLPQDAGIPAGEQQRLAELLQSASKAGVPVRVALIASPTDLGSITELWRQPQSYASFLGQELGLVYHGTLLVVMPNGYGTFPVGGTRSVSLRGLPPPGSGPRLATAALSAVQRLSAAAGHKLRVPNSSRTGTGAEGASVDIAAWLAFAIGVVLIIAAWAASVRIRPLRAGNRADAAG